MCRLQENQKKFLPSFSSELVCEDFATKIIEIGWKLWEEIDLAFGGFLVGWVDFLDLFCRIFDHIFQNIYGYVGLTSIFPTKRILQVVQVQIVTSFPYPPVTLTGCIGEGGWEKLVTVCIHIQITEEAFVSNRFKNIINNGYSHLFKGHQDSGILENHEFYSYILKVKLWIWIL